MKCKHCNKDSFLKDGHILLSDPPVFECYNCSQPERSKREDCEKGVHSARGFLVFNNDEWKCDYCDAVIRRCGALNIMET